jgi:hypothetical protein
MLDGKRLVAGWHAHGECARRHVLVHHGSGGDETPASDPHAGTNRDTSADADMVLNRRALHGAFTHGILGIQKRGARPNEDEVANRGAAGHIDMRHDLDAVADLEPAFERALVMHHAAVADGDLATDQRLMAALKAMPDAGVCINDAATADDGVISDARGLRVAGIAIAEDHAGVDLRIRADFCIRFVHLAKRWRIPSAWVAMTSPPGFA